MSYRYKLLNYKYNEENLSTASDFAVSQRHVVG